MKVAELAAAWNLRKRKRRGTEDRIFQKEKCSESRLVQHRASPSLARTLGGDVLLELPLRGRDCGPGFVMPSVMTPRTVVTCVSC